MTAKRYKISMTEEMDTALVELATERGQPVSYVIREAIAAYLERSNKRVQHVHPGWGGKRK